ncbi:hypothetical protein D8674_034311 [Pyrus ussuriensis x Pyrus communis]|uniref:Uncharacterized protein n=1 Tax=Pyrus ussuriensis x Pyrus communis TaxID=2448454 RepID=A0A5N5HVD9_9ROSA|nr:hypothetical protein D8674_034275 [Pyrus ussuriensis x Pyrus communis]KAB2629516.1 hypothetical protein D8674_034311 [Pyrus ussuriensis x Pyrus communis]
MGYSDDAEELLKRRPRKMVYLGNPSRRQLNSRGRSDTLMGEMPLKLFLCLTGTNVLKGHSELAERLSRDANKIIYESLQKEFEDARASQTQENYLDGERWNDGLLATIRERVTTCLEGARIGKLYEISYAGML